MLEQTDTELEIGAVVRERVSEQKCVVMGYARHISGCNRWAVYPIGGTLSSDETWCYEDELQVLDDEDTPIDPKVADEVTFEIGNVMEDEITGFEGYATTITYPAFNCPQVALTPTDGDTDREWFDAPRLEFVREGITDDYDNLLESTDETATGPSGVDLKTTANAP